MSFKQWNKLLFVSIIVAGIVLITIKIPFIIYGSTSVPWYIGISIFPLLYLEFVIVFFLNKKFNIGDKIYEWMER